eukprot:7839678-Lingulodinium_polyedra.AAC.1
MTEDWAPAGHSGGRPPALSEWKDDIRHGQRRRLFARVLRGLHALAATRLWRAASALEQTNVLTHGQPGNGSLRRAA